MKATRPAVLLAALFLCGGLSAYSQEKIPKDLTITLERTMCPLGHCPAYTLRITADGSVKFTPDGAFAQRGDGSMPSFPLAGTVTTNQIKDLLTEFQRIKFFSLKNRYRPTGRNNIGPSCPEYWTDSPTAVTTIIGNGRRKKVSHYLGCQGADVLDQLVALEQKIDDTANAKQWISQFGWSAGSVVDLQLNKNVLTSISDKQLTVKTTAVDPDGDVLTYQYIVSGGKIVGTGAEVIWDLANTPVGTYTITAGVDDGCGICGKTVTKTVVIK